MITIALSWLLVFIIFTLSKIFRREPITIVNPSAVSSTEEEKTKTSLPSTDVCKLSSLLQHLATLAIILIMVYLGQNQYLFFEQGTREYSGDLFLVIILIIFGVCLFTVTKSEKEEVLSREQSDEWRGWMQLIFLLYHYYNAQVVYNPVRVFVSCYVWMTGFGNFSYFYTRGDTSLMRFVQMLWRLNFSPLFICLITGNSYFLYYIIPLHTFYFCMIFLVMSIGRNIWNHNYWWIRGKLIVTLVVIYVVWEFPEVYEFVFGGPLGVFKQYLWPNDNAYHDFHFRTYLDHYSALFGMIFALNYPIFQIITRKLNDYGPYLDKIPAALTTVVLTVLGLLYFAKGKTDYNATHPYISFLFIVLYVFLRNSSPALRSHYLKGFTFLGKITLETYLLQHHIWLTKNAKAVLVIRGLSGFPILNSLIMSTLFVFFSYRLYYVTMGLKHLIFSENAFSEEVLRNLKLTIGWLGILIMGSNLEILATSITFNIVLLLLLTIGQYLLILYFSNSNSKPLQLNIFMGCGALLLMTAIIYNLKVFNPVVEQQRNLGFIGNNMIGGIIVVLVSVLVMFSGDSTYGIQHICYRLFSRNFSGEIAVYQEAYGPFHKYLEKKEKEAKGYQQPNEQI